MMGIEERGNEESRCLSGRGMQGLERKLVLAGNLGPPPVLKIPFTRNQTEGLTMVWKMFLQ